MAGLYRIADLSPVRAGDTLSFRVEGNWLRGYLFGIAEYPDTGTFVELLGEDDNVYQVRVTSIDGVMLRA